MSDEYVIRTEGLSRKFGRSWAVRDLDLRVPRGSVFGFLGMNGAGKTTTIKMLLGLLEPSGGKIEVLGLAPPRSGVDIRRRTGYVAENQKMYGWMTIRQILRFVAPFYPSWNAQLAEELLRKFRLDPAVKLRNLSAGMNAKVALTLALAHEPELLVLDDPTSGLDAVVRREFLESIVEVIHREGRTVFFSSHIIHEVERVADWIGIVHEGELKICEPLEKLKAETKRIRLTFPAGCPSEITAPGMLSVQRDGRECILTVAHFNDTIAESLRAYSPADLEVMDLSLEDIFVEMAQGGEAGDAESAVERVA